jgi:hypothetical protein
MKKTGKIYLKKTTRLTILTFIALILLSSIIATILAFQNPATTIETITIADYSQTSSYTYFVHLKNNTLYDMPFLLPNQGIYFKQIIDNITASITYNYQSSLSGPIQGNYSINAEIKTDLWTKKYPLINQTSFSDNNQTTSFAQFFPINYSYYDDIVEQITTETGITAPNPMLIIHTNIILTQITAQGIIHTQSSPELTMTLTQKTIEISENLTNTQPGSLTQQTIQSHQSVILQRNIFTVITVSIAIVFCLLFIITDNAPDEKTETEKTIKKIYKRNGEWIHKTVTPPPTALQHTLRFASIEDLIKIGEDLNKPIFHYTIPNSQKHIFYILDSTTTYLYELSPQENLDKSS